MTQAIAACATVTPSLSATVAQRLDQRQVGVGVLALEARAVGAEVASRPMFSLRQWPLIRPRDSTP